MKSPAELPPVHASVVHMLVDAAERAPDREAIVCGDERMNYSQYLSAVASFAEELIELGAAHSRVVLLMRNSIDFCIAMFAVQMAGAQVAPLNPQYTGHELSPLLKEADAVALIHDDCNSERDEQLSKLHRISLSIAIGKASRRLLTLSSRNRSLPDLPRGSDLAALQFTGGTTGKAKGADITHAALAINIAQREALVPTHPDRERILCVMPLFHCYAIHMCMHNMVHCRGTLVIVEPYHPVTVLETIDADTITLFGGSPTLFAGLMSCDNFAQTNFSSLEITYSGAAPLAQDLLHRWEAITGSVVIEGYGQTEAGPVISFNPVQGQRKQGSVGVPVPLTEIEIVDLKTGNDVLAANECGEIRLRGPQIMSGYRNRPADTAEAIRTGWLYTGDIGELDDDGYLFIRGRKKEMIIVSGYNVYPNEVEEVLLGHASVAESAVVGVEDSYRGELPVAFLVRRHKVQSDVNDLKNYCSGRLAAYKVPTAFHFVETMPKTSVGKLDKVQLRNMAETGLH